MNNYPQPLITPVLLYGGCCCVIVDCDHSCAGYSSCVGDGGRRAAGGRAVLALPGVRSVRPSVRPFVRSSIHVVPGYSGVPRVTSRGWCCARCAGARWGPPAPSGAKHRAADYARACVGAAGRVGGSRRPLDYRPCVLSVQSITNISHARHHRGSFPPVPLCTLVHEHIEIRQHDVLGHPPGATTVGALLFRSLQHASGCAYPRRISLIVA